MRKFILFFLLVPALVLAEDMQQADKNSLINKLKQEISNLYILDDKIPEILASLDSLSTSNELKSISNKQAFSEAINNRLKQFDKHFSLRWEDPKQLLNNDFAEKYWTKLARKNSGFTKVEILEGNIGYIDFWGFDQITQTSKRKVASIMSFVSDTDALIFDLRNNGGGHPEMVQLISSYLFGKKTLLNKIYWRYLDQTIEFWTLDSIQGKKMPNVPVYILTSSDTFSAAEEFAYNLQSLERATVVGETTAGGAHPVRFLDFGNGFVASIPFGKAINPITHTNWEWIGVSPNVKISKKQAFDLAYQTALKALLKKELSLAARKEINEKLDELAQTDLNSVAVSD